MNRTVSFCERLVSERKRKRLNQTQFAELGGVTVKTQVLYEKGERFPDARYLMSLSAAGVDVLYVLTGELSSGAALLPNEQALLAAYRALDAHGKVAAIGAVSGLATPAQPTNVGGHSQVVTGGSHNVQIGSVGTATKANQKKPQR